MGVGHLVPESAETLATAHLADTTDAHDASAISYAGSANLSATDVEAALDELDTEKVSRTTFQAHLDDVADARDASAISVLDTAGNYTATDVEGVLAELPSRFVPGACRPYYLDAYNNFFLGPWVTGQGTTSTTLTAQASAGASTLAVTSGASFPNDSIIITNQGTANQKQYKITSGGGTTTLTVTPTIATTLANGATITPLWTNSAHLTSAGYTAFCYWFLNATSGGSAIFTDPGSRPIVWLGDSWATNGATEFAAQVAAKFPSATATNAGVSGNTSTQMLARFGTDVPSDAAYVIINEPGVNDVYQALTEQTIMSNLTDLVAAIRALGATPVITGMVPLADYPGQSARRSALLVAQTAGGAAFPAVPASAMLTALAPSSVATTVGFGGKAQLNTTGANNTAVGYLAQLAQTTGSGNTAVGQSAQAAITSGANNVAIGHLTQQSLTTGTFNTAVGQGAQSSTTGSSNTAVGAYASLSLSSGGDNTHVGYRAGYAPAGVAANATTTAAFQTCIGQGAGQGSTTQVDAITCIGAYAVASGTNATAIGSSTSAGAAGAVAIGRDSAGTGASTSTANEIKVGTALHTTNIIGNASIGGSGKTLGFYGATPAAKPTGVAVSAAGVHAALVTLGLIAA